MEKLTKKLKAYQAKLKGMTKDKLKKIIKKAINEFKASIIESWYIFCWNRLPLRSDRILLQSRYGDDLGGNIFYLLKNLSQNYKEFRLYLAYKPENKDKYVTLLKKYGIKNIHLVRLHRFAYWKLLATCKYLINDVTFHSRFIKREGQHYLNTWHGTPLKKMGYEEAQSNYAAGNMQRNFLACDYLLCPNTYMTELMVRAYSLNNLFRGKILNEGYPRNAIFFDKARAAEVRKELGLEDCQVIMYMPTWRGNTGTDKSELYTVQLKVYLDELDQKLTDKQVFFVKMHPLVTAAIDLSEYTHIKPMPKEYETYDFLNAADCLVTDYSSIMFDYACSGKNIVLFNYDQEEYLRDRGIYIDMAELPFNKAQDIDALLKAVDTLPTYMNDQFMKGIVEFEKANAAQRICDLFLNGKELCQTIAIPDNGKENIFIFIELLNNGISSAAFSLINQLDTVKRNYFCVFNKDGAAPFGAKILNIPDQIGITSLDSFDRTLSELFALYLYYKRNWDNEFIRRFVDQHYKRMFDKYYANVRHDVFVQFVGYGRNALNLYMHAPRKFVFVHNDMKQELAKRKVQHENTLVRCYKHYDRTVGISLASTRIAAELAEGCSPYSVAEHNCFDYNGTRVKATLPIAFSSDTECLTPNPGGIESILNTKCPKYITIGSFAPEKEHIRLLEAFNLYWQKYNNQAVLIILGRHGSMYNKTLNYARKLPCINNICIIKYASMTNYLNILKGCNLFILSSSQENVLPNVLLEADCLGVPILSTNVEQAERLLNAYGGGLIVDQSAEALYEGMIAFDQGKVKPLNIDMCVFNRNAAARMADELTDCQGTYRTVHNCFNYLDVLQKSKLEISFDPRTECATSNTRGILGILDTKAPKFITIGRFSPEKQHLRLLQAFNKYYENVNNDARLIIIGGHGPMYNKTIDAARKLPCANNVCIIKALSNPHSILSKCDLFILPSSHEGLPVVFFEADCLGKPILSTALDGPRELFGTYGGGLLVNQSVEALYEGMLEFDKGNIKPLNIDMEAYNQKCIAEFESLFD